VTISEYISSNRGSTRVYDFSFNVDKGIITYYVDAQITYNFDVMSGWNKEFVQFTPEVSYVALAGTRWEGSFDSGTVSFARDRTWGQTARLNQTHVVLEFCETSTLSHLNVIVTTTHPEVSQRSVGTFDPNTLALNLTFSEWIVPPSDSEIPDPGMGFSRITLESFREGSQLDLVGVLNPDGDTLSNHRGTTFNATFAGEATSAPEPATPPEDENDDYDEDEDEEE